LLAPFGALEPFENKGSSLRRKCKKNRIFPF
jgi:hypothetical protein